MGLFKTFKFCVKIKTNAETRIILPNATNCQTQWLFAVILAQCIGFWVKNKIS